MENVSPRFGAIGLVVQDMAASLAFYRALGLDIPAEADGQPHVGIEVAPGVSLMWDTVETVRSFDPDWQPPSGGHRVGLAFHCGTPAGVDAAHVQLVALGFRSHKEPWDAFWGQRYAMMLDPDGNGVDLFAELE